MSTSLTRSRPVGQSVWGRQTPTFQALPDRDDLAGTSGQEAIELSAECGLFLDPWQQHVLTHALRERADGMWAAFEVGVVLPRQNGKGGILEARELASLLLLPERRVVHSAHRFDTSVDHFERMVRLIESSESLDRRVKNVRYANDDKHIEMLDGTKLVFKTRVSSGGRGLDGDLVVLDEAFSLPRPVIRSLQPLLTTAKNPQLWFTSTPVNQTEHPHGLHLAGVRERALAGGDPRLAWFEWGADEKLWEQVRNDPDRMAAFLDDVEQWANANPAGGIRITREYVADERRSFANDIPGWVVERLGIGDWPSTTLDGAAAGPLDVGLLEELVDESSVLPRQVVVGVGVAPDRDCASVAVAGLHADGRVQAEVVASGAGVRWAVDEVARLVRSANTDVLRAVVDGKSDLAEPVRKIVGASKLSVTSAADVATGCARLVDLVNEGKFVHPGQQQLLHAAAITETRRAGGGFAWKRPDGGDVTPLQAVSQAVWGVTEARKPSANLGFVSL